MKHAPRYMSALVSIVTPLMAMGCVSDDASRAFDPDDLCAQTGGDRVWYEPIWTFEPGERSRQQGELLFSDDGSLSGQRPRWDMPGDGVVGYWAFGAPGEPGSDRLGECLSHTGAPNTRALNFWGPVSGSRYELGGVVYDLPGEGFTFSGGTVTLASASYDGQVTQPVAGQPYWARGGLIDASEYDGVSFWARLARPEEAIGLDEALDQPGYPREPAIPQFGESQLGVLVQTIHTGLVEGITADGLAAPADPSIAPVEAPPPCADYNPWLPYCNRVLKEGGELPSQCLSTWSPVGAVADGTGPTPVAYCRQRLASPEPLHPACLQHIPKLACERPEFQGEVLCEGSDTFDADPPAEQPVDDWNELESAFRDQCWDGFRTVREITHQWRHYFLPFSEMRQAGWGRVAESFETDKIRSIGLMTSAWQPANVLVDEIALYKTF